MRRAFVVIALAGSAQAAPPTITSGDLLVHFSAEAAYLTVDGSNEVQSWVAANDASIVLNRFSSGAGASIAFDPTGLGGAGAVVFDDASSADHTLRGLVGPSVTGDVTIFWLGFYANSSIFDGRYVYSINSNAGSGATQYTHQSDRASGGHRFEIYDGDITFGGDQIGQYHEVPVVWRTQYMATPVNGVAHRAWVNCTDLNVAGRNTGYTGLAVPRTMYLGGWQGAGYNFTGRVGALLIYDGLVNDEDAATIISYLHRTRCPNDLSGSADPNDPCYGVADGIIDASDFFYFLDQFAAGNLAVADLSGSADPNDPSYGVPDGFIDAADFFYFLDQFVSGCA